MAGTMEAVIAAGSGLPAGYSLERADGQEQLRAAEANAVEAEHTNAMVMDLFNERREITSLAVVEHDRPIGLINRDIFLSQMLTLS